MTESTQKLIDSIGAFLPAEVRTAFYREMMYCRSLREDDEMLRILRVMQFLTLLMEQVPGRVVAERERLEGLFGGAIRQFEKSFQESRLSLEKLDRRLVDLPGFIAAGISPEEIVAGINHSLQKAFDKSTIPETSVRLRTSACLIQDVGTRFTVAADGLVSSYRGVVEKANAAVGNINRAIGTAANTSSRAAERLTTEFHVQYWWPVYVLIMVALMLGFIAGVLCVHQFG
jgi:hypothetical protein